MPNEKPTLANISDKHRVILDMRARRAMAAQLMRDLHPDPELMQAALNLDIAQREYRNATLNCLERQRAR